MAGVLAIAGAAELATTLPVDIAEGWDPQWWEVLVAALGTTVPLAWRRRYPEFAAAAVVLSIEFGWVSDVAIVGGLVALYAIAAHGRRRRWVAASVACYAAFVVPDLLRGLGDPAGRETDVVFELVASAIPPALGATVRLLRERRDEVALRVEQLQAERAETARRAVFEERVHIARELHDVVAHHVSVMGIQAGAARLVLGSRPEQAADMLAAIERSSRDAVAELRQLLGYLRRAGEPEDAVRQPGLAELAALVAAVRQATLEVEGDPLPVPRAVEISVFRVVQEALTNSVKYSGGGTTRVLVRHQAQLLEIEVIDSGPVGSPRPAAGGGHGLVGMRERVELHGGQLRVGPRPVGGFEVHATFPLAVVHA